MTDLPENLPPDARFPVNYNQATGKGDIHIPGAGTFGMVVLIMSLSMLFIASVAALLIKRVQSPVWPPLPFPHIPNSLWISTLIIPFASVTIHLAHRAIQRDDDKGLRLWLIATFVVGVLFMVAQAFNWIEYFHRISSIVDKGAYAGMFYILTALHAAHVVGGLIPLAVVYVKARLGRYSRNFHPGVRYAAIYWHFLDVVWLVLFAVLFF